MPSGNWRNGESGLAHSGEFGLVRPVIATYSVPGVPP
jgi:hypothetical protein